MADSNLRSIMNLGNSIVGVSILAMPYCFSKCGIALGTLLLIFCTLLTQWTCKMLMKAAVVTRNQTYENLALGVLGAMGKYITGLSVIGLNLGTCIAFFVIIGDLAPPIIAQATGVQWSANFLRAMILIVAAVFVVFPLGMLRSVDSLSVISLASLIFYAAITFQLFLVCFKMVPQGWWNTVSLWDNSGLLKCIPIFALAFSCQTQLFIIYSALQDTSIRTISTVIDGATVSVATLYFLVALFGYMSFYSVGVKGDVLANFDVGFFPQLSRCGFSLSVMVSFPLMIFPCRVSMNSLFFSSKSNELHVLEPIPQKRFVAITTFIIVSTLAVAILIPNVETVLSLTGATMGNLIAFIIPSVIFLKVAGWNSEYSKRAKLCALLGISMMILSTTTIVQTEMNRVSNMDTKLPVMKPFEPHGVKPGAQPEIPLLVKNNEQHDKEREKDGVLHNKEVMDAKKEVDPNKGHLDAVNPGIRRADEGGGMGKDVLPEVPDGNRELVAQKKKEENQDSKEHPEANKNIEEEGGGDRKVKNGVQVPGAGKEKVQVDEQKNGNNEGRREIAANQKNIESNDAGAGPGPLLHDREGLQQPVQGLPDHQEPEPIRQRNVDSESKANQGKLEQLAKIEKPDALDRKGGKEDNNEIHNQLREDVSKLNERLKQLEKENQNLKQRQEAMEGIEVEKLLDGDEKIPQGARQGGVALERPVLNLEANKKGAEIMQNEIVGKRTILEAGDKEEHNVQRRDLHGGGLENIQNHQASDKEHENELRNGTDHRINKGSLDSGGSTQAVFSLIQDNNGDSDIPERRNNSKLNQTVDVIEHRNQPPSELVNNESHRRKAGQRDLKTLR